tara:strand:+ start:4039 stop:4899 length:861 start_codon:yes stop_codon:yes gene_type:complete
MKFTKMHGIGNDYVYIDARHEDEDWPEIAKQVSDRHFGIGGDGLILIHDSDQADLRMQMFNADGSEGEMCGNGIRCFVKLAIENDILETRPESVSVETLAGILTVVPQYEGNTVSGCTVNMGPPILNPADIPVSLGPEWSTTEPILNYPFQEFGQDLEMAFVSMGNPHAICFMKQSVDDFPLEEIGPKIERHPIFPNRVNFEIVNIMPSGEMKMRVWERGSGITLACGTGACAVAVAANLKGMSGKEVRIHLPGGPLDISWGTSGNVYMTGSAEQAFTGQFNLKLL